VIELGCWFKSNPQASENRSTDKSVCATLDPARLNASAIREADVAQTLLSVLFSFRSKATANRDTLRTMKRYLPLIALSLVIACNKQEKPLAPAGDANRGKQLIDQYGCTACHIIPGIDGPKGMLAPSLEHVASRPIIATSIPNSPQNMIAYIQNPQLANPQNVMPNLSVKPGEARDIAAYLYTLK
jgi:cytochrome c